MRHVISIMKVVELMRAMGPKLRALEAEIAEKGANAKSADPEESDAWRHDGVHECG